MARGHGFGARVTVLSLAGLLMLAAPPRAAAQAVAPAGALTGTATDTSDGVLPGVLVTATADGRTIGTAVTDASGTFTLDKLPAGPVALLFHLGGFDDATRTATVSPGTTAAKIVQRLTLQGHTETVVVRGALPPPPPPPRLVAAAVPAHDQDAVCGPAKAEGIVQARGMLKSRRDEKVQGLFGAGDELLIDGGAAAGLQPGQNFVVRRRYPTTLTDKRGVSVMGEHSSGLLQIVSVDDTASIAVVVYACDEMMPGDYLAAFEPEPGRDPDPVGVPAFDAAARILFADAGQTLGATDRMLVIDRGERAGVRAGQRFTIFRRSRFAGSKPVVVGEAIVVAVRRESATIRVEQATDAIFMGADGDWAAPQHAAQRASN